MALLMIYGMAVVITAFLAWFVGFVVCKAVCK